MSVPIEVGVMRVDDGQEAEPGSPTAVEVQAQWVRVGDVVLDGEHGLVSVQHKADCGPGIVTIELVCAGYRTVDHRMREVHQLVRDEPTRAADQAMLLGCLEPMGLAHESDRP